MSLWADYIKEHRNDDIVELDGGFAVYRFVDDNGVKSIYIVDLYVKPRFRYGRLAKIIANQVVKIGKSEGCTRLLSSVAPHSNNSTYSLKVALSYGMELYNCIDNMIVFKKEI